MAKKSQSEALGDVILKHRPGTKIREAYSRATALVRAAKELSRIAERQCSEEMSERETARVKKRERALEAIVLRHCEAIGVTSITFDGDPRGYVVKLHFGPDPKRQPGNTMGGPETGWGIG